MNLTLRALMRWMCCSYTTTKVPEAVLVVAAAVAVLPCCSY